MSDKGYDLHLARVALEQLEQRRERAWNGWIRYRIGTELEREQRRVVEKLDEDLVTLRARVARLEAETKGKRWLRSA